MFKNCAIASEDDEARSAGCAKLAKALREVVQAEQSLQAQNEAHASGVVGKAVVRERAATDTDTQISICLYLSICVSRDTDTY
eukprot:COSAG06_NODE_4372_length_4322_cov_88.764386_3_plen_83_part_00